MNPREIHEYEAATYCLFNLVASIFVHAIPLVECNNKCRSGFEHITQQMQVLFDDTFMCIKHKHNHMSVLNGLQGFNDGKFFDCLNGLATFADASRIDKRIVLAPSFKRNVDTVARGAG